MSANLKTLIRWSPSKAAVKRFETEFHQTARVSWFAAYRLAGSKHQYQLGRKSFDSESEVVDYIAERTEYLSGYGWIVPEFAVVKQFHI